MTKSLHTIEYEHFRSMMILAREKSGLTQKDVASSLNRPQSFVSKYECGERRLDVVEFIQICIVLGVDPRPIIIEVQNKIIKE